MKTIKSTVIALLLVIVLAATVSAQSATTLGRWVQNQPVALRQTIGCDLPTPYSTRCWRHVVRDGRIVETWHYRQETNRIVMWRETTTERSARVN